VHSLQTVAQIFGALEADTAARQHAVDDAAEVIVAMAAETNGSVSHTVDGHVRLSEGRSRNEAGDGQRDQFLLQHAFHPPAKLLKTFACSMS
jgi:hypothetical protein